MTYRGIVALSPEELSNHTENDRQPIAGRKFQTYSTSLQKRLERLAVLYPDGEIVRVATPSRARSGQSTYMNRAIDMLEREACQRGLTPRQRPVSWVRRCRRCGRRRCQCTPLR